MENDKQANDIKISFNQPLNNNSRNNNFNNIKYFIIFISLLFIIILILIISILNENNQKEKIDTENLILNEKLKIIPIGFNFNQEFDENKLDYNLEIDTEKLQIRCNKEIIGCNETIDMSGMKSYNHIINYKDFTGKEYNYKIHILKKEVNNTVKINSILLDELHYTNTKNNIVVDAISSENEKLYYSFDGGNTWQDSNKFEVDENEKISVIVKDGNGNLSNTKNIEVDNIDKISPTSDIIVKENQTKKIILNAYAIDELSGIYEYNWNNQGYTNNYKYEVTKAGTYTLKVKDKAGNESEEASVTIPESMFNKKAKKENRTYTVTIIDNGTTVEKDKLTCTTTDIYCTITLPKIIKDNGVILGYSKNKDSTVAAYKQQSQLIVTEDMTIYPITYTEITATFNKNGVESVSEEKASCYKYNNQKECKVMVPTAVKSGNWEVLGFSTNPDSKEATYNFNSKITINDDTQYYAISRKKVLATFSGNGAAVKEEKESCYIYNTADSCKIKTPQIVRNGWQVLGFSDSKDSTEVIYEQSKEIEIDNDINLYAVTGKKVTVNFNGNGAIISDSENSCYMYNTSDSCRIKTPKITRQDWNVLGFSPKPDAETGSYNQSSTIDVSSSQTFYAITSKTITLTFEKNGADMIEYDKKTCNIYNKNTTCNIRIPIVNRLGYISYGFDEKGRETSTSTYHINTTYKFSKDKTLIANFSTKNEYYREVSSVYNTKYGNVIVEIDNSCPNKSKFISDISALYNKMPFLFKNPGKIMILNDSLFNKIIGDLAGLTYGYYSYPIIDIKCSQTSFSLSHEMAHKWDREYNARYKTFISLNSDIGKMYQKYRNISNRPFRDYSYNTQREFFADMFAYYYSKYVIGNKTYETSIYPNDIKNTIEKYISNNRI